MSIQCRNCGSILEDNVKFCRFCGNSVEQSGVNQGYDTYAQQVQQQVTQGYDPNMYNQQAQQQATQGYDTNAYGQQQGGGSFQQNIYIGQSMGVQQQGAVSKFDGSVLDTFLVALGASLLVGITFGIATPWAICIMMKFIFSHVIIDGRRLYFDGNGGQLIGNWIKWFLLMIITFGIYSFWVMPKMYDWVAKHTHFA
ncbi:MAG: DUF898 family protein [Ruminococcus sp.]|nr:DUF898 family protein [Ruminococcus sp.]